MRLVVLLSIAFLITNAVKSSNNPEIDQCSFITTKRQEVEIGEGVNSGESLEPLVNHGQSLASRYKRKQEETKGTAHPSSQKKNHVNREEEPPQSDAQQDQTPILRQLLKAALAEALNEHPSERRELEEQGSRLFNDAFIQKLAQYLGDNGHSYPDTPAPSPALGLQSLSDTLKLLRQEERFPLPIFVLGSPRSGTTLIGNYIGSCAKVCNLIEYPGFYLATKVGPSFQKKVDAAYKPELYNAMFDFMELFSADLVRRQDREAYVDSNPFNFRIIKQLQKEVSSALFIVMLRDYRGVITSLEKSYKAGYSWAGATDLERVTLYYKFYKRLKNIDLERVIFLNYDQLCASPNEALNAFQEQFYGKLKELFKVQSSGTEWQFNRRILCENQAPTYLTGTRPSLLRTFRGQENNDGTFTLSPIVSYNSKEWSSERDAVVYGEVSKVVTDLTKKIPHKVLKLLKENPAFAAFYNSLENLRKKHEDKVNLSAAIYQGYSPIIWNVPLLNRNFIGREVFLQDLHTRLQEQSKDMTYSVITGMPGVGKTQLVKNYANLYKGNYHLVWWFNGSTDLDKQYESLAQSINDNLAFWNQGLNKSLQLEKLTTNFTTRIKDWLRTTCYNWLLIFDDVPDESSIRNYFPENQGIALGHIIVTSKNSNGWPSAVHLKTFERFESIQLLKKLTGIEADQINAEILAETLLGNFPLALAQAGAYIKEHSLPSFQEYISLYMTKRKELEQYEEELRSQDKPVAYDSYNATIAVTFNLALEEIQKDSPEAFDLLTLCAFIHKRNILEEILAGWLSYRGKQSSFAFRKATRQLRRYSLIEKENTGKSEGISDTYALHELVQRAIRDKLCLTNLNDLAVTQQDVLLEVCKYFTSEAKYLFKLDFYTLVGRRKSLSYLSQLLDLIGYAKHLHITYESLDEAEWLGKILFLVSVNQKLVKARRLTPDDNGMEDDYKHVFDQAKFSFGSMEEKGSMEALNNLLELGKHGHPSIQNGIAYLFDIGFSVTKSPEEAVAWYLRAAEQEDAEAQFNLGYKYTKGKGIIQSDRIAADWYQKAAEQGYVEAQFNLGKMYDQGQGVEQDKSEAAYWYRRAAEQGEPKSQFALGMRHHREKDFKEAANWYLRAAKQGYVEAQYNLAFMYAQGEGFVQNDGIAAYWYRQAAEQGYVNAQFNLGIMCAQGRGTLQDNSEAAYWYRQAAEQGEVEAQFNLALMYEQGQGVEQNDESAFEWYQEAAKRGEPQAQYILGMRYVRGQGCSQDFAKAAYWYRKAAKQGYANAQCHLAWIIEGLHRAAEKNHAEAQRTLDRINQQG